MSCRKMSITVVFAVCLVMSFERNRVWHESGTLWSDVISKNPQNVRGYNNLGSELVRRKKINDALSVYRIAVVNFPRNPEIHYNLARCLIEKGSIVDAIYHYGEAIKLFNEELADEHMGRYSVKIRMNLSKAYADLGSANFLRGGIK